MPPPRVCIKAHPRRCGLHSGTRRDSRLAASLSGRGVARQKNDANFSVPVRTLFAVHYCISLSFRGGGFGRQGGNSIAIALCTALKPARLKPYITFLCHHVPVPSRSALGIFSRRLLLAVFPSPTGGTVFLRLWPVTACLSSFQANKSKCTRWSSCSGRFPYDRTLWRIPCQCAQSSPLPCAPPPHATATARHRVGDRPLSAVAASLRSCVSFACAQELCATAGRPHAT